MAPLEETETGGCCRNKGILIKLSHMVCTDNSFTLNGAKNLLQLWPKRSSEGMYTERLGSWVGP